MHDRTIAHVPVLLEEAVEALRPRSGGVYVDCTFGRGGHTRRILADVGAGGRVIGIDKDPLAAAEAGRLSERDGRFTFSRGSFARLRQVVEDQGGSERVDGILFDLGVSSAQLDDPARGFSFLTDGPLDMRMDRDAGPSAAEWLRTSSEARISDVIREYGEERYARRIARAIVRGRREAPIDTTLRLARIVAAAAPTRERRRHPATRTFQALRIVVNHELEELEAALEQVPSALAPGGRLVAISFHSLEDRIVKRFMRQSGRAENAPRHLPLPAATLPPPPIAPVGGVTRPAAPEIDRNPRARSAVMRVAEARR